MSPVNGKGPRAVALSPDGKRAAVAVYFTGNVELIEHWGANTVAHLDAGVGRTIPVYVDNLLNLDLGSELRVGFSAEDIIFFDPVGQFSLDYRERYYHGGQ